MKKRRSADEFFSEDGRWRDGLNRLREIMLGEGLEEAVKWGGPVYMSAGKNIVGIGAFKNFFALWFFQGALLTDNGGKLINAQEGVTKALRQWRFTSADEIDRKMIAEYVREAVANELAGKTVKPQRKPLVIPPELEKVFSDRPEVASAFDELTLTQKREFAGYIDDAKRESTKIDRLEKIIPMILGKTGLHDKYR